MYRASRFAVIGALIACAAPAVASQTAVHGARSAAKARVARATSFTRPLRLPDMDLTPKHDLVRPYGERSDVGAARLRTAIDYRIAGNGPVMSLGYHRFDTGVIDPSGVNQPSPSQALQPRSNVGALVTYPFR